MVARVDHPTIGPVSLVSSPLKFEKTPIVPPTAPPTLGQHTEEVLAWLNKDTSGDEK